MALDKERLKAAQAALTIDDELLRETVSAFRIDMRQGLMGDRHSSLRMLRSYVALPTGQEKGEFLALDFGGTNVRVVRILLKGNGEFEVIKKVAKPLVMPGVYNHISASARAEEMFDFIAELVEEAIEGNHDTQYLLGHTFSFPSKQTNIYNARLIIWTKEFATKGVEGEVVNDLLKAALNRKGIPNVEPVAVINDTVAVLLAAAYKQADTYIGSIYATGQNNCYFETFDGQEETPTVINMESGGFNKLVASKYDLQIDETSEKPGEQRLEKMVSGRYLGTLFGHALADVLQNDRPYRFTSIDLSAIVMDEYLDKHVAGVLLEERTGKQFTPIERAQLQELAATVIARSARLVAMTYAGIIRQRAGADEISEQYIAVDGSVYEKMPLVKENVREALKALLGKEASKIHLILENAGSALGAAIAAAMTETKH